jgi:hypothetical protein
MAAGTGEFIRARSSRRGVDQCRLPLPCKTIGFVAATLVGASEEDRLAVAQAAAREDRHHRPGRGSRCPARRRTMASRCRRLSRWLRTARTGHREVESVVERNASEQAVPSAERGGVRRTPPRTHPRLPTHRPATRPETKNTVNPTWVHGVLDLLRHHRAPRGGSRTDGNAPDLHVHDGHLMIDGHFTVG